MESKMFLISLFMFACIIQSSFALRCFTCESISNPKCLDVSDKSLQPQDCAAESFLSQGAGLFSQVVGNSNANKEGVTPVCLKIVSRNTTYANVVARRCAVKWQGHDPCVTIRTTLQQTGVNSQVASCDACNDKDGCNSGNSMNIFVTMIVFATMASTARLFV